MNPLKVKILKILRQAKTVIDRNQLHLTKHPHTIQLLNQKVPVPWVSVRILQDSNIKNPYTVQSWNREAGRPMRVITAAIQLQPQYTTSLSLD